MSVNGVGMGSSLTIQSLVDMRYQLTDLQRQLGTGKKSDSYAGLGLDRGLVVGLRSQLSAITGFRDTISQVGVRLNVAQTALSQFDAIAHDAKTSIVVSPYQLAGGGQTNDQKAAFTQLDQMLGLLNTQAGDRYIFSGRSVDQPAVGSTDSIINGDGARAGLKQLIDERRQADLGASGLGRLVISAPTATSVQLAEDAAPSAFGFKLTSVAGTLTGATIGGPSGSPPAVSVDLGAANPSAGETVRFSFALPDGTTADLTLTATNASPPGPNEFTIGASSAATAANLQTTLTTSLGKLAGTTLTAASAMAAGNDFFNVDAGNPPQRVDGPPFDTATGLKDGTPADTVTWYTGEAGTDPARSTATARADQSLALSYGMRGNEEALREAIRSVAVFAATSYSATDANAEGSYDALKTRVVGTLIGAPNQQKITDIESDLAGTQSALAAAKDRHQTSNTMLSSFMQEVEGVTQEEVAAQILALQTSLQASLQTTALLLRTSLINYL